MIRSLTSSSAICLVFLATGASADVTPQEVWASWQAMATAAGQELTVGNTSDTGSAIEVTDVVIAYKDDLGGSASVSFDALTFTENGDGTVTVGMPESYPIQMAFPKQEDGPGSLKLTVSQPGAKIVAGGSATETSYEITAPATSITLDEVTDEAGTKLDTQAEVALTDMAAKYSVSQNGEGTVLDSSFSSRSMVMKITGKDAEGAGGGTVDVSFADVTGATKGNFLSAELMANMAAALNSGFTMDTSLNFGAMTMTADITDEAGPSKLAATATGGGFVVAMDKTRLNYGSSLNGAKFTVSGADIPFPQVEVAFAESGFNIVMPVSKSDVAQDFSFLTKVVDFTVSEDIWGLFDPAGSLSREPATVIVDLKGMGYWEQDLMDPSLQMEGAQPPGKLESLDLTQVLAKAAGAEVSATGGLTFDNTDLATFGGVPRPDGKITINIKGVNQLVDNLIALGILTDDDAMGFRMGLGMFARPGAGPDELVSEIEFKDGGLFANGMQLQ
ncbi:MAG: DUF2125 domain-containing protein [Tabrizicola sp.]|uniref:DUF2125 domain-containing protein n=1 Tax=Tabrizicola sp. TaxID=2005166 RepID=UPI002AB8A024|nr:DUF2125 domain-containing protein [Tabrizicola sp.]MDZ4089071.1 DUF2125 domain-containing protein [Tabrizicola sp.]